MEVGLFFKAIVGSFYFRVTPILGSAPRRYSFKEGEETEKRSC